MYSFRQEKTTEGLEQKMVARLSAATMKELYAQDSMLKKQLSTQSSQDTSPPPPSSQTVTPFGPFTLDGIWLSLTRVTHTTLWI